MREIYYGDIFLVKFDPSFGHEYQKVRPALIVSSNEVLKRSNLVSCIAITSNSDQQLKKDDIFVSKDDENRLHSDSVLKMHHITSFDKGRIKCFIGKLNTQILNKVKKQLKVHFSL